MFSIGKNGIFNTLDILRIPHNFALGKALLVLLPLYFQMVMRQMSTQTDNHKCRKNVATKVQFFKKWVLGLETLN